MSNTQSKLGFNPADKESIFNYSKRLINHSLLEVVGEEEFENSIYHGQGKGGLEQMLEALFFKYEINSSPLPDFEEAGVELKGTGLKKLKNGDLQIKERLVCDMINYMEVVDCDFEHSPFWVKCKLMLIIFYLYEKHVSKENLRFIYTLLWQIPEKDLLIIRHDYDVIIEKIKEGRAHELTEGDTQYLAACRKGATGADVRRQPYSDIPAPSRAFSLKPAYMRTVLDYVKEHQVDGAATNVEFTHKGHGLCLGEALRFDIELTSTDQQLFSFAELMNNDIETLILGRIEPYYGWSVEDLCREFGVTKMPKDINYRLVSRIVSKNRMFGGGKNRIELTEEFKKGGIIVKTIPLKANGTPKESMSFENIDYLELGESDEIINEASTPDEREHVLYTEWINSRLYELFTSRFLMVVFQQPLSEDGKALPYDAKRLVLKKAFYWTMPSDDLIIAKEYWDHIREVVGRGEVRLDNFWRIKDKKNFHVRPKGSKKSYKNAGKLLDGTRADKYSYWFNAKYVKKIVWEN